MGIRNFFKKGKGKDKEQTAEEVQAPPPQDQTPQKQKAPQAVPVNRGRTSNSKKQESIQPPAVQPKETAIPPTNPEPQTEIQNKQQSTLDAIALKRKQIDNITKVLKKTEEERTKHAKLAIDAKNRKKVQEATRHAKQAARLKSRIENLDNQLNLLNEQLFALEDAGVFLQTNQELKTGNEVLKKVVVDEDELDATLADNREQLEAANAVGQALKVDANLYGEHGDGEALLDDLEEEFADEMKTEISGQIPDVPTNLPNSGTPGVENIEALENDISTAPGSSSEPSSHKQGEVEELQDLEKLI